MLGSAVYMAALFAPEIASAAGEAAGSLVEATGQRLASGICTEVEARLKSRSSSLLGALVDVAGSSAGGVARIVNAVAAPALVNALDGCGVVIVRAEELRLLRELAANVATNGDTHSTLDKLKAYLAQPTST